MKKIFNIILIVLFFFSNLTSVKTFAQDTRVVGELAIAKGYAMKEISKDAELTIRNALKKEKIGWKKGSVVKIPVPSVLWKGEKWFKPFWYTSVYIKGTVYLDSVSLSHDDLYDDSIEAKYDKFAQEVIITRTSNSYTDPDYELTLSSNFTAGGNLVKVKAGDEVYTVTEPFIGSALGKLDLANMLLPHPELILNMDESVKTVELNSELKPPEDLFSIKSSMGGQIQSTYIKKPDFSKIGRTSAEIEVTETLDDYFNETSIEVLFDVVDGRKLSAEAIPQEVSLGMDIGSLDAKKLVKNVEFGGKPIKENDYEAVIKQTADTNTAGEKKLVVSITEKENNKSLYIDIPIKVQWNNSLKVNGTSYQTILGLTTHERSGEGYSLVATRGQNDKTNNLIHASIKDEYVNISLYHPDNSSLGLLRPYYQMSKNGSDTVDDAYKSFAQQETNVGDIVKVKHRELLKGNLFVGLFTNNKWSTPTTGFISNEAFFEITDEGRFKPIHINQLRSKTPTIKTSTTNEELDKNKSTYMDLKHYKNITVSKIVNYPDRTSPGKKPGKILVEETLNTGKKVQQEYEVVFNVEDNRLTADAIPQEVELGRDTSSLDPKNLIKNVKSGDEPLNDYKVEIKQTADTNTIGDKELMVTVKRKLDNESIDVKVPVKVKWGSTILLKGAYNSSVGAFTLQNKDGKYNIASTEGTNRGISDERVHFNFLGNQYYKIERKIPTQSTQYLNSIQSTALLSAMGEDKALDKIKSFGNRTQRVDVNLGDIINVWHAEPNTRHVFMVDEKETTPYAGFKDVYYEITKKGFQPLHVNQLTPKKVVVKNGDSEGHLKEKLQDSIDLKGYKNLKIERFQDKLPDTGKDGEQKIPVVVSETLQSGKKVEYTYQVPFVVNPVITENIYKQDGTLVETKQTEIQHGKDSYLPNPQDRLDIEGTSYQYKGWLSNNQKPGEDTPQKGKPGAVKESTTFHYIYEDINQMIQVKIPVNMIFSSSDKTTQDIQSDIYRIENLSDEVSLHIQFASFKTKESAGVKLLKDSDFDPTETTESMRLHLLVNEKEVIHSLNETSSMINLGTMKPKEVWPMKWKGTYFGDLKKEKKVTNHQIILKFKADV